MAANCTVAPTVTNGVADVILSDTSTANVTYTCNAGYTMAGNATIFCDIATDNWTAEPRCNGGAGGSTSGSTYYYYPTECIGEWWYYLMACLLIMMLLTCFGIIFWCCCCCRILPEYPYILTPVIGGICCYGRYGTSPLDSPTPRKRRTESVFWASGNTTNRSSLASVDDPEQRHAQIYKTPRVAKEHSKMWMPHKNNVRTINTSTK